MTGSTLQAVEVQWVGPRDWDQFSQSKKQSKMRKYPQRPCEKKLCEPIQHQRHKQPPSTLEKGPSYLPRLGTSKCALPL